MGRRHHTFEKKDGFLRRRLWAPCWKRRAFRASTRLPARSERTPLREAATLLPAAALHLGATLSNAPGSLKPPAPQNFKGLWDSMKPLVKFLLECDEMGDGISIFSPSFIYQISFSDYESLRILRNWEQEAKKILPPGVRFSHVFRNPRFSPFFSKTTLSYHRCRILSLFSYKHFTTRERHFHYSKMEKYR